MSAISETGFEPRRRAVEDHGGSLARARALFPQAPEPWIDLSTGINPHSYPHRAISATAITRLPEPGDVARLQELSAALWNAPSEANVTAAPGTQILLPMMMSLVRPGNAAVLSPTYAEHARSAVNAGHRVQEVDSIGDLAGADIAILVNPNNPDGRITSRAEIVALARRIGERGGLLVVDEAFMDAGPMADSVAAEVETVPLVVLRSFGKFFGLAGVRLGFAIASKDIAEELRDRLGPWAISGPALEIGAQALADLRWQQATRSRLAKESQRLDELIQRRGLKVWSGTDLFRFVRDPRAPSLFAALGRAGIIVRAFDAMPDALRFGIPGDEGAWTRLDAALALWSSD